MRTGRVAEEHVAEHPLRDAGVGRVPDEVRTELAPPEAAERHVGAEDVPLGAVRVGDGVERDVRVGGLDALGEFDVVRLGAADDPLLLLGAQGLPGGQIVQVLLHEDVTASGERWVLVAHQRGGPGVVAHRVLRTVDESQQVAVVEVAEPLRLVHDPDRPAETVEQLRGPLVADVRPLGPDVQEQVAGGGRGGVARSAQLLERVQQRRTPAAEEPVPGLGAEAQHTGEPGVREAEAE